MSTDHCKTVRCADSCSTFPAKSDDHGVQLGGQDAEPDVQGESRADAKHRVASLRARAERQRDVSNLRHGQGQQPSGTYCCYSSATCMYNDVNVISWLLSESRCLQLSLIVT